MTVSYPYDQVGTTSSPDVSSKDHIRQAIRDLLVAACCAPSHHELCGRCGQQVEFVETVFWLYEEESAFCISVPICACAARIPA